MYEFPDEIWKYILDFVFDWKRTHMKKLDDVFGMMYICSEEWGEIYERWTHFPPFPNTNDIIRAAYANNNYRLIEYAPTPNLELTSITWNVKGTGGWWCGYGWRGFPDLRERDEWYNNR